MGAFWCQNMPWHYWVIEKRLSEMSIKLTCSCGKQYAVHEGIGIILPWDREFEAFYADGRRMRVTD